MMHDVGGQGGTVGPGRAMRGAPGGGELAGAEAYWVGHTLRLVLRTQPPPIG